MKHSITYINKYYVHNRRKYAMDELLIPKTIHYIWFGHGEKSDLIKRCIHSTIEKMDGWEIKEWTEDNYNVGACDYCKEAYQKKKYAFASDYARFDILYRYGGIYLDTDVELIKRIPDEMLKSVGFTGIESNNKIAPGLVFACQPGNPIVKEIIEMYKIDHFILPNGSMNTQTVVNRVTEIFFKHGFEMNGKEQIVDGFHVYPVEYFCAYDFVTNQFTVTDETVSIHHYTATWTDGKSQFKRGLQNVLRKLLGVKNYKKLLRVKRKLFGVNGE